MKTLQRRALAGGLPSLVALLGTGVVGASGTDTAAVTELVPPPSLPRVAIGADISRLPGSELAALSYIVAAARVVDAVAMRYAFPGTFPTLVRLAEDRSETGRIRLDGFITRMSPWREDGKTFVSGVLLAPPPQPGYPSDATKEEVARWWAQLPAPDRALAQSHYSVIRRGGDGRLFAVPFSVAYGDELGYAADLLSKAAQLTGEPTLKRYLLSRSGALRTDDYRESDIDFVQLSGAIDVLIGPEEPDDDWFGVKFPFETGVGLVNDAATQRVRRFLPHLQELEDALPLPVKLRARPLGRGGTIVVLDAIYQGQSGGTWVGYGLPDDAQITREHGRRTGLYLNLLAARYKRQHEPIAASILSPADAAILRFEDVADEIAMVRLFDALGPQTLATGGPFSDALAETTEAAQQIQSMLLSLWAHQYLIDNGKLDRSEARTLYSAFLVPAVARAQGGLGSSSSQGSTYILNYLLEARAFRVDQSGHALINPLRAREGVIKAIRDFIPLRVSGDVTAVRARLARYVVIGPEVRRILDHVGAHDGSFQPEFVSAAGLDGVVRSTGD
jgi:hypothetical protein